MQRDVYNRALKMAALAAVMLTTMGQAYLMPSSPLGTVAQTLVSDDFNRSSSDSMGDDWTETIGDTDIINDSEAEHTVGALSELIWDTNQASATQWVTFQRTGFASDFCGPKLMVPNLSGTENSYTVRWQSVAVTTVVRECVGTSCSDIYSWANGIATDHYLGVEVRGTGQGTEFAVWDFGASAPGVRSGWGDAGLCVCYGDDGAGDDGTCALLVDCDTALIPDREPGTGNYADCALDDCYVGIYSGSTNICQFDNFTAGWD